MKLRLIVHAAFVLTAFVVANRVSASTAIYSVTFTGTWSQASHPGAYPAGPTSRRSLAVFTTTR